MGKINIPLNYPNGCNEEEVKEVMENCHKYIAGQSKAANVVITPPYYKTIIELGNIGGLNFLYSLLNSLGCI